MCCLKRHLLLFLFVVNFYFTYSEKLECTTPAGKPGFCVFNDDCPSIVEILKKKKPSSEELELFRQSYCGNVAKRHVKVCCDKDTISTCPSINETSAAIKISCYYRSIQIQCASSPMVNATTVYPNCKKSYEPDQSIQYFFNPIHCVNGAWDGPIPQCCKKEWQCDVFLIINKKKYAVNKRKASENSKVLNKTYNSSKEAFIYGTENISLETIQAVVTYINSGKTTSWNIYKHTEIIDMARILQAYQLENTCIKLLHSQLKNTNYFSLLRTYSESEDSLLADLIITYIEDNFEQFSESDEWKQLNITQISAIIQSEYVNVKNEETVLKGLMNWIDYDWKQRKDHFINTIKYIHFDQIQNETIRSDISGKCKSLQSSFRECFDLFGKLKQTKTTSKRGWLKDKDSTVVVVSLEKENSNTEVYNSINKSWSILDKTRQRHTLYSAVALDGELIIFGGVDNEHGFKNVTSVSLKTAIHSQLPPMLETRVLSKSIVINGYIYILGGINFDKNKKTMERYDPTAKTWSNMAQIPVYMIGFSVGTWEGKLYVVGGSDGGEKQENHMKTLYIYDTQSDKWSLGTPMEFERIHPGVAAVRGYLYVIGGHNTMSKTTVAERLDLKTMRWRRIADLPIAFNTVSAVGFGFKILAISGSESFEYDTIKDQWSITESMDDSYSYRNMLLVEKKDLGDDYLI
ncbi:kelch-like protein 35 isoform X2 [Arctopsyche grandis]|uniref:kelch-like protein 35 isoform X2 n=1 Tax=Arctopsyche grandis TaxID=121162 RepID=UPI00406D8BC9